MSQHQHQQQQQQQQQQRTYSKSEHSGRRLVDWRPRVPHASLYQAEEREDEADVPAIPELPRTTGGLRRMQLLGVRVGESQVLIELLRDLVQLLLSARCWLGVRHGCDARALVVKATTGCDRRCKIEMI